MLNIQTPPPKQVLLRLPEDLAAQLARAVPPRKRNQYILDVIAQDLANKQAAESQMLVEAAEAMNALEAQYPELARETEEWVNAELTDSVDKWDPDFDRAAFVRDVAETKAARASAQKSG